LSRIISDLQKREIFKAIPAQVMVGETTVTASKIWANQKLTSYPSIAFNISQDGTPKYADVSEGVLYYQSTMTIHILTETVPGIPGVILAEEFAREIVSAIETWVDPLAEDVRIFDAEEDISAVQSLGTTVEGITDLALSVKIYHA